MRITDPIKFSNRVVRPLCALLVLLSMSLFFGATIKIGNQPITGLVVVVLLGSAVIALEEDNERRKA